MSNLLDAPLREIIAKHPHPKVIRGIIAHHESETRKRPQHLKKIETDIGYLIKNFLCTYNEATAKVQKFPSWPFIYKTVLPNFHAQGNCLWEKAQRMLITVSATAYMFGAWLTIEGFTGWMTSRKENRVDDGGGHSTWDSLFGKIRFYYEQLARRNPWVIEHFMGNVPSSDEVFRYMIATNKKKNSALYGEAPIPTAPTGSGFVKALVDEAAVVPQLHSIHGNLMFACPNGTHYISYPDGMGNYFAKIRHTDGHFGFKIVTLPHNLRPDYDNKWLKHQQEVLTPDEFGRRIMISYSTSVHGRVWESFSRSQNIVERLSVDINDLQLWFDFGFVDATSVGIVQVSRIEFKGEIKPIILVKDWLEVNHTRYKDVANALKAMLEKLGYTGSFDKLKCYGDPQVKQTIIATGTSLHDLYRSEKFNIEAAPVHDIKATLDEINKWFSEGRILIDSEALPIIKAAENWSWPKDRNGNVIPGSTKPVHDEFSHAGKAFEYGFCSQFMKKQEGAKQVSTSYDDISESEVLGSIGLKTW